VNCKDFQDRISAAVDRCLDRQEMKQFEEHACCCGPCREEYDNERSTKDLLRQHTRIVRTPADLRVSLLKRIDRESGFPRGIRYATAILWHAPALRALTAFALTALLVIFLVDQPRNPFIALHSEDAGIAADDVVRHSVDSYHGILRGEIVPQMGSGNIGELRTFFSGKTTFPVVLPMKECAVVGGLVDELGGTGMVHILYRVGKDTIYLCQASWETIQEGRALQLSAEAKGALVTTGWYAPRSATEDAVVLWRDGGTLCIAVSHMDVDRLLASVKSGTGGSGSTP